MSTAGKVLSVLAVLLSLVWIVLASTVAELNRNGTKVIDELTKKNVKLAEDLKAAQHGLQQLKDKTYHEQLETDNDIAVLRGRQSELEKSRSQVLEISSRLTLQLESMAITIKQATQSRDLRAAEKVAEIKAKEEAEAEVVKLKGENSVSLARLAELREQFKTTLEANRSMSGKLDESKSSSAPTARTVSRIP